MKTSPQSLLNERGDVSSQIRSLRADISKLFTLSQGRIRFGSGGDGDRGENLSGQFQQFTSDASANTEFSVTHTINAVPVGAIILWQDKAGSLYQGPTTGTAWTSTTVYFKCSVSSVTFLVFLLK